jgi:uncharacterized protein YecE (DUF72 family)
MIRIGVAGWDYPDWGGTVYPSRVARGFDRLAYLTRFVDLIEINTTFYRPAAPRTAESWVRRTEPARDFVFTAKAHRSWTHGPEGDIEVSPTLEGLQPLRDAGRLGALLLQFPQSFHFGAPATERIDRLLPRVAGWPVVLEVRHVSWMAEAAADWARAAGLGWCVVDQPAMGTSTAGAAPRVTGPLAYLRLHGRNAANWFREDAGRDARYDYLYSTDELTRLADTGRELARTAESLFVVQNNHFRGQALSNALQMAHLIRGDVPEAPPALVACYPQLAGQVRVEKRGLF